MRKQAPQKDCPAQMLLRLVESGRVFELQRLSEQQFMSREELANHPKILLHAVKSGFHSLVETVIKMADWSSQDLQRALSCALHERRGDLVELLINAGIAVQDVDFEHVCRTLDVSLMKRCLIAGADPTSDNAFARALDSIKARPLLRFYKDMRAEYPALDDQAALALSQAVSDKSVRWVCLLIWAGADPFRKVPYCLEEKWDEESCMTTAAAEACWHDDDGFIKVMKLKPTPEQAQELCLRVAFKPTVAKFQMILKNLSAEDFNRGESGSCGFLEELINHRWFDFGTHYRHSKEDPQRIQCIEYLLKRGAKWNPSDESLKRARYGLSSFDGLHVASVIRLLLYIPGAAGFDKIWELCRTPKMRSKILFGDDCLLDELNQIRKHHERR
jgi:hypothetical protein